MRPSIRPMSCTLALATALAGCGHDAARDAIDTPVALSPPAPQAAPSPGGLASRPLDPGSLREPAQAATVVAAAPAPAPTPEPEPARPAPATTPAVAKVPLGPRLWSKARFAWIQPAPHFSKGWLGYLGLGSSIALHGGSVAAAKVPGSEGRDGCRAWYAVDPRGYVCEGDSATLDASDPAVVAVQAVAPRTDSPWPYDYGESLGAPRYKRPPSAAEQRKSEWDLAEHLGLVARARAGETPDKSLAGVDLSPAAAGRWGKVPDLSAWIDASPLVREGRTLIANGSTVAYTGQVDIDGRTFLVTHDRALVPKDRVRPYPRSEFEGVEIGEKVQLPVAFFRAKERPKYRREADGSFVKTGASWPRLAWVALTGDQVKEGKQTFLATREAGLWVAADDAQVARLAEPPALIRRATSGRRTWVDVSVLGGTLVAYEGERPVFATLISPGRGGVPYGGLDPIETASTPVGTFRVDGKFVTATMVSSHNDLLVHTEVQYVQNFHGAHALHGAYWHDVWGEKKSGGCVNLSPKDAKRLFAWTDPPMPEDWYGLRAVPELGPSTVVVVHK